MPARTPPSPRSELKTVLLWGPRFLAFGVALYFGLFAVDAFTQDKPLAQAIPDFLLHVTPSMLILGVVVIAWKRQWVGAAFFAVLAVYFAITTMDRPDWILAVAGPLALVAFLYGLSWWKRETLPQ